MPSLISVNRQEPIIFSLRRLWNIEMGSRIPRKGFSTDDLRFLVEHYSGSYSIYVDFHSSKLSEKSGWSSNLKKGPVAEKISVFFSQTAVEEDVLRAAFEAEFLAHRLNQQKSSLEFLIRRQKYDEEFLFFAVLNAHEIRQTQLVARKESPELFRLFSKLASFEGFDLSRNYMGVKEWRVTWKSGDREDILTLWGFVFWLFFGAYLFMTAENICNDRPIIQKNGITCRGFEIRFRDGNSLIDMDQTVQKCPE